MRANGRTLGPAGASDDPPVTFINFGAGEGDRAGAHRAIPGGSEEAGGVAAAESVGALPAHADGPGSGGDAAGTSETFEEAKLARGGPTVPAAWLGNGAASGFRIIGSGHRAV